MKNIALFDFDNTLIDGDSVGHLLKYYFKKHPYNIIFFIKLGILFLGYLCKLYSFNVVKKTMWQPFYLMDSDQLNDFIETSIKPHYYANIFEDLDNLKKQGYYVIVVSASIVDYLKALNLNVDGIIGTEVTLENNKIKDILVNCIGPNKVPLIEKYLNDNNIQYDKTNSMGYSDSKMDYMMLKLVDIRHRVQLKTGVKMPYTYTKEDYDNKKIFK